METILPIMNQYSEIETCVEVKQTLSRTPLVLKLLGLCLLIKSSFRLCQSTFYFKTWITLCPDLAFEL